ncbi:hypothetical protein BGZ70_004469 [Mortierella alpina]|uniref:RRM domain-containing protein n=1 Tax=Mortierella alpina TaxID=64518 RepID=A0A9P6JA99_MORAP|nr:hypothetical protein BGZ70_004469 [Mortierella alpina]
MDQFTGIQGGDTVDVLPPNDHDVMEDVHEESHHRRSAYPDDDNRDFGHAADHDRHGRSERERTPDRHERHHSHSEDQHRNREHNDRDDKYDRRASLSNGHNTEARHNARRSRSRSPAARGGSSSGGGVGPVAHADVLLGHDGRSKGCGVVEYQNADDARTAIRKLNDVVLMGRPVFVREDRESEARIGFSGGRGGGPAPPGRRDAGPSGGGGGGGSSRQVFVGNLPYSADWKDLKDLFKKAGAVDRADVFMSRDNRSKGSGTVSFDSAHDDKFGPPAGGSSRGMAPAASSSRYEPSRDHGRGGDSYGHDNGNGRGYRDEGSRGGRDHHASDFYDGARSSGHHGHAYGDATMAAVPSGPAAGSGDQIYIRNLPLTTTSQDLRDLFRTCGAIRMTEMLDTAGRSKGSGIVRFEMYESADKAVAKFNGYVYGGRPLEVIYDRP